MENEPDTKASPRHLRISEPSPWVRRFAPLVAEGGQILDLACGGGRHARLFLEQGHRVLCVDKNTDAVADLSTNPKIEILTLDLETDAPVFDGDGPLAGRTFDGIVVCNYLFRPHLHALIDVLAPGGLLIYETFARGNERFNRPRNPDHLLKSGELLDLVKDRLQVVAFEHGLIETGPLPGVKQRLAAVNNLGVSNRDDGDPEPMALGAA